MATFTSLLADQEGRPEQDPVGWLARQWKAAEGNRPRVSSPTGVKRHLTTLAPDTGTEPWLESLARAVDLAISGRNADLLATEQARGRQLSRDELDRFHATNQP